MQSIDTRIRGIAGFSLTSSDASRLVHFYQSAFAATLLSIETFGGAQFERLMQVRGGATCHHLKLGEALIDILEFETSGNPYPEVTSPYDTVFQHFAIVVNDMASAIGHLRGVPDWVPMSSGGPQHLPQRSGGVTAYKLHDPDGHPLELLAFPADAIPTRWQRRVDHSIFLGIDHTAISVRDTARSREFYGALGFSVSGETVNRGIEQARLDGMPDPQVEVTALSASPAPPHLELLCYQTGPHRSSEVLASNDIGATRTHLTAERLDLKGQVAVNRLITDPDHHHLLVGFIADHLTYGEPRS